MTNLSILETFRTKEELLNYFDEIGQNITEEEIENLKKSYEQAGEANGTLSLQQLDDVAGGGVIITVITFKVRESQPLLPSKTVEEDNTIGGRSIRQTIGDLQFEVCCSAPEIVGCVFRYFDKNWQKHFLTSSPDDPNYEIFKQALNFANVSKGDFLFDHNSRNVFGTARGEAPSEYQSSFNIVYNRAAAMEMEYNTNPN